MRLGSCSVWQASRNYLLDLSEVHSGCVMSYVKIQYVSVLKKEVLASRKNYCPYEFVACSLPWCSVLVVFYFIVLYYA
jgi:hypothetical protein